MRKRVEQKVSQTAQWTCFVRALSFQDARPNFKCEDWLASRMLSGGLTLVSNRILRHFAMLFIPKGSYEQVIARTKYIDEALEKYSADTRQVLIFGAGFDTRSIRFGSRLSSASFFELDAPSTQRAKIELLMRRRIPLPPNLVFVPTNFETDSMKAKLEEFGFYENSRTIFILEGLTMYLSPDSIDAMFSTLSALAGSGSTLIADFFDASVRNRRTYPKGKGELAYASLAGEEYVFGIDQKDIEGFLRKYSFEPVDISNSQRLTTRFLMDGQGNQVGAIRGQHSTMVTARKV